MTKITSSKGNWISIFQRKGDTSQEKRKHIIKFLCEVNDYFLVLSRMCKLVMHRSNDYENQSSARYLNGKLIKMQKELSNCSKFLGLSLPATISETKISWYVELLEQDIWSFDNEYRSLAYLHLLQFKDFLKYSKIDNRSAVKTLDLKLDLPIRNMVTKMKSLLLDL